eukprot:6181419-Pleurochrysis_carterae.AAC.3
MRYRVHQYREYVWLPDSPYICSHERYNWRPPRRQHGGAAGRWAAVAVARQRISAAAGRVDRSSLRCTRKRSLDCAAQVRSSFIFTVKGAIRKRSISSA